MKSILSGMHMTTPDGRVAPKQNRSARSEQQIIAAAVALLTAEGYPEFTMSSVSGESGVSIGGVYRRFPTREGLLQHVKNEVMSDLESTIEARVMAIESADSETVLSIFTHGLSGECTSRARLFAFIFIHSANDSIMRRRGFDCHVKMKRLLVSALERCPDSSRKTLEASLDIVHDGIVQSLLMRVTTAGSVEADESTYPGQPDSESYATELVRMTYSYLAERSCEQRVDRLKNASR